MLQSFGPKQSFLSLVLIVGNNVINLAVPIAVKSTTSGVIQLDVDQNGERLYFNGILEASAADTTLIGAGGVGMFAIDSSHSNYSDISNFQTETLDV